jgi:hypothetical protein
MWNNSLSEKRVKGFLVVRELEVVEAVGCCSL